MLIELLSSDNYGQYNISIAQQLGLNTAVYLSELLNINDKAIRKAKLNSENFFTLDRKYIEKRTTITKTQQLNIDKKLIELGILNTDVENPNVLSVNITVLLSFLNEGILPVVEKPDNAKPDVTVPQKEPTKRKTKKEVVIQELKGSIKTTDERLQAAYYEWIDSVYQKLGWMSNKAVYVAQREVEEASRGNTEVALKIIEIATVNGWKDITWAIKSYKKDYEPSYRLKYTKLPEERSIKDLGEEVF